MLSGPTSKQELGWAEPVRLGKQGAFEAIPTWQQGHPQEAAGIETYLKNGQSQSAIYACVNEIATSFAELPGHVVDADAEPIDHPVTSLLENPNDEMDGNEFAQLLTWHHRLGGNVYIQKVRQSNSPARNQAFRALRVKELGLIRPDRVKIVPGSTRADDVFEVSVGGAVVQRLPRADVIHVKTPNTVNDFYGLSPVEVIAKEGDLDTNLTSYDLAFFKNAGVPFGILTTMTRHTPDEKQDIQSSFRKALSGINKWFRLMILNAEEAKYIPMGGMPKDLEMTTTRHAAESRICAVYGVPPIIVGLLVGMQHATYSNYEQAQFSYWSETMVPYSRSIASALTRELLSEFATTGTRGAKVMFDLSGVRALQEDNSGRLESANQMIVSGAFTVNQALELNGLPAVEGGDFYVRNLNQVIDTALPAVSSQRIDVLPSQPDSSVVDNVLPTAEQAEETVEAASLYLRQDRREKQMGDEVLDRLFRKMTKDVERFFKAQARRAASRLPGKSQKALEDDLIPIAEDQLFLEVTVESVEAGAENGWVTGAAELGAGELPDKLDDALALATEQHGRRIEDIGKQTRSILKGVIAQAREEGASPAQLADRIRSSSAFSPGRAQTIARTELALADNLGAAKRYEEAGVTKVEIIDGPDCGWETHTSRPLANGQTRTVKEFLATPIAHPNCVRSRSPVVED